MANQFYQISPEEFEMFSAMDKIGVDDIRPIMQRLSCGKIKKLAVGKLIIINRFFPTFKDTILPSWEGLHVFYAYEKFKPSLFSKPFWRIFIWRPMTEIIAAVPVESVAFRFDEQLFEQKGIFERFLLFEDKTPQDVHKDEYRGKMHTLTQEGVKFCREFSVTKDSFVCKADICSFDLSWSEPDSLVYPYTSVIKRAPMYYLRHGYKENAPHHQYPPYRSFGEIDE